MKNQDGVVRVGGVGTGRIFQWAHDRAYPALLRKAFLVGMYDVDPARCARARTKYAAMLEKWAEGHPEDRELVRANLAELRVHDSLDSLIEQVDLVDVCTHSRGRMAVARAALQKGVHAMVEKPMARTWIEADRTARAFEVSRQSSGGQIFCQLNDDNVFEPLFRTLHDLRVQGAIGKFQLVSLVRGSGLDATTVLRAQADPHENGGGCLMDYGSHGVAGVWYMLGTHLVPRKVEAARLAVRYPNRILEGKPHVMQVEDDAHIKVLFEDPADGSWVTVFLEATWSGGEIGLKEHKPAGRERSYLRIAGDDGVLDATEDSLIRVHRWDGGQTEVRLREYPEETVSFSHEIETAIDCVRTHTLPAIDIRFGAEIIAVIGAAYYSALQKRAVTIDEFKAFSAEYVKRHGDNEQAEEAILADLLAPYRSAPA